MFDNFTFVLAQEDAPPASDPGVNAPATTPGDAGTQAPGGATGNNAPPPTSPFGGNFFLILILMLVFMYLVVFGGQRKEKKKREAMLAALNKGNKVQTVGGIIGTVVEVRDSEVVVKVDESNNTRLKFTRAAIQSVVQDKEE